MKSLQSQLLILFKNLTEILEREREQNWIRGIRAAEELLKSNYSSEDELRGALLDVKSIYQTMNAGYGSFSDYGIWKENYEERVKDNEELDKIKGKIWQLIEEIDETRGQATF